MYFFKSIGVKTMFGKSTETTPTETTSEETKKPKTIDELIASKEEQIKDKKDYIKEQQNLLRKFNKQKEMMEFRKYKANK